MCGMEGISKKNCFADKGPAKAEPVPRSVAGQAFPGLDLKKSGRPGSAWATYSTFALPQGSGKSRSQLAPAAPG